MFPYAARPSSSLKQLSARTTGSSWWSGSGSWPPTEGLAGCPTLGEGGGREGEGEGERERQREREMKRERLIR